MIYQRNADEVAVGFGLVLGAETGVVVAKGTGEVHFSVTLTWKCPGEATIRAAGDRRNEVTAGAAENRVDHASLGSMADG